VHQRAFPLNTPHCPFVAKIPPNTRKRTAAEAKISSNDATSAVPNKKIAASAAKESTTSAEPAPPTPVTGMDSDEDFLSTVSSDDDVMQDSDNDGISGGEGMC
jgi:ariadne-1